MELVPGQRAEGWIPRQEALYLHHVREYDPPGPRLDSSDLVQPWAARSRKSWALWRGQHLQPELALVWRSRSWDRNEFSSPHKAVGYGSDPSSDSPGPRSSWSGSYS